MIRIAGSLVCAAAALLIAWRAATPHAAFFWTLAGCGWLSDATHYLRDWFRARWQRAGLPAVAIMCGNCPEHKVEDHLARRIGGEIVWICYGDDKTGGACPCPGFKPEPRR